MAASLEHRIISEIIRSKNFRVARRFGLQPKTFDAPEFREMFKEISRHFTNKYHFGHVPSPRHMSEKFPGFELLEEPEETLEELCNALRLRKMEQIALTGLDNARDKMDAGLDPNEIPGILWSLASQTSKLIPTLHERTLHETIDDFIEWYDSDDNDIIGLPFPWKELTNATNGMDSEDLTVIFGRPKTMKTFLGGHCTTFLHRTTNVRALIYSCEMNPVKFERRLFAELAQVDYQKMKRRELCNKQEERLRALRDQLHKEGILRQGGAALKIVPMSDTPEGMSPLQHLGVAIESFRPDIVYVDSAYRMAKRNWEKQAELITELKTYTGNYHTPILVTTQRSRAKNNQNTEKTEEDSMEDVAFTDAIVQESDLVIRVRKIGREPDGSVLLELVVAGGREIEQEGGTLVIRVKPCVHYETVEWLSPAEVVERNVQTEKRKEKEKEREKISKKEEKKLEELTKSNRWRPQEICIDELDIFDEFDDG